MTIIDGAQISKEIIERLKREPRPAAFLAAVLIGEDPASASFLKQKEKVAKELGIDFRIHRLPETIREQELREKVREIAGDADCGGIIVQLPLPNSMDRTAILEVIPPKKDVDALRGGGKVLPPAVGVVEKVLQTTSYKLQKSSVAVVGANGFLVGKPVSLWLKDKARELLLLDIDDDLSALRNADIIISGTGMPGLIRPDILKPDAFVIDFGYGMKNGKVCGDFDPTGATTITFTPTPGGTGPVLVAQLFENFYLLNKTPD